MIMSSRALIYQIYPASFGNLKFIAKAVPTIAKNLQPDYIWLSPIFKSPWQEGGYDVADYQAIDPRFGTIKDLQKLIATAKKHHIKILLDLVINHTSTEHPWFEKSRHRDPWYADYYVWMDRPLNWRSFFGGPACEYDSVRGQYYLHLFDKSQPDLNFKNPRVVKEFQKIIKFWTEQGIAGFRVDSANVLSKSKLGHGFLPFMPGFFRYFQTPKTIKILEKLFSNKKFFTLAEPVGGTLLTRAKFRELTAHAFDASFNIGTLDVADTYFSVKTNVHPVNYKKWLASLVKWTQEPTFSFALESHDTPRATSRFNADAKALAMLQFLLPSSYPCIYQGQELGMKNPKLSSNINAYPGVQSRAIYKKLISQGKSQKEAIQIVKKISRDNARQPIDWIKYESQAPDPTSVYNFYRQLIHLWRNDPVIANGALHLRKITRAGIFDFIRTHENQTYSVHVDLSGYTPSTLVNSHNQILLTA